MKALKTPFLRLVFIALAVFFIQKIREALEKLDENQVAISTRLGKDNLLLYPSMTVCLTGDDSLTYFKNTILMIHSRNVLTKIRVVTEIFSRNLRIIMKVN